MKEITNHAMNCNAHPKNNYVYNKLTSIQVFSHLHYTPELVYHSLLIPCTRSIWLINELLLDSVYNGLRDDQNSRRIYIKKKETSRRIMLVF